MRQVAIIALCILAIGCTRRTYNTDNVTKDDKIAYELHCKRWGFFVTGGSDEFHWYYSRKDNFTLLLHPGKVLYDLSEVEIYSYGKRKYLEPYYHGSVRIDRGSVTLLIFRYNQLQVVASGKYKAVKTSANPPN
jgi:hypothetical protein